MAANVHAEAVAALGGNVEILINNAGGNARGNTSKRPAEIDVEDFVANYRANMLGAVQLCQLCVPDMVEAKFGRIVNVSSAVAMQPNYMGTDYSAAKAALLNYTFSLAGSLRGVNVTANVLTPGIIMVDGVLRFGRQRFGDPGHELRGSGRAIRRAAGVRYSAGRPPWPAAGSWPWSPACWPARFRASSPARTTRSMAGRCADSTDTNPGKRN